MFESVKNYVYRSNVDDWKRSLVCGFCLFDENILAINVNQIIYVLSKSKSTTNIMFQSLEYSAIPTYKRYLNKVSKYIPIIENNVSELRTWSIRIKNHDFNQGVNDETEKTTHEPEIVEDFIVYTPPDAEKQDAETKQSFVASKD
ncbi:potassium/sodium hyperpolarization-activated cyclic nucleotide-gated channel 1 [Histomonas meleagridis]|uniref:potassium/sodium hyperpolarization-activated cyclic nucleotide-gated channel 1 n=1 Tax=Histomonas meleagridis TaxID=135588 RepID=UPI003559554F|nr:potassium/sodium hyperpolarization-activated cyclic nucleotide-gated channel 1 [Histomonas meleagridis]KAH0796366.1 potassium/sodium hyperpolarization-activated cyclic nucleotide-gated channel 1 [Histomonas meleagridis]